MGVDGGWGPRTQAAWDEACPAFGTDQAARFIELSTSTTTSTAVDTTTSAAASAAAGDYTALEALTANQITAPAANGDSWSVRWPASVNNYLRWRQTNCRLAFYGSTDNPSVCDVSNRDPHREHLVAVKEAHDSGGTPGQPDGRKSSTLTCRTCM